MKNFPIIEFDKFPQSGCEGVFYTYVPVLYVYSYMYVLHDPRGGTETSVQHFVVRSAIIRKNDPKVRTNAPQVAVE